MERPRAHSVLHVRPPPPAHSLQARASKLLQKVSAKLGGRASQDRDTAANSGPYLRRGAISMDGRPTNMKPFMSQPMLALPHAREDQEEPESDGSASPARSEFNARRQSSTGGVTTAVSTPRPPPPSRAPPPPPNSNSIIPTQATAPAARILPSSPPIISSPPSSYPKREEPPKREQATSVNLSSSPSPSLHPMPSASTLTSSESAFSTASYATARSGSSAFSSSAYSSGGSSSLTASPGLPSLARLPPPSSSSPKESHSGNRSSSRPISGLPHTLDSDLAGAPGHLGGRDSWPASSSSPSSFPMNANANASPTGTCETSPGGRPPGAQAPADPHQYTYLYRNATNTAPHAAPSTHPNPSAAAAARQPPVIPPFAFSDPATRRASLASTLSATSEDSFATALSGAETPTGYRAPLGSEQEEEDADAEIEMGEGGGGELERRTTIRASDRERADTLRAASGGAPQAISVPASAPASASAFSSAPSSSPTTQSTKPQRVVTLTSLETEGLNSNLTGSSIQPSAAPSTTSPTLTLKPIPPWGSAGLAPGAGSSIVNLNSGTPPSLFNAHNRARTTSAGFASPSSSSLSSSSSASGSPRIGYSTSTGTGRRVPLSLHRFSMTFNPSSAVPTSPGSLGSSAGDMRLSPSIIMRQPPLAIPVLRLPPTNGTGEASGSGGGAAPTSPSAVQRGGGGSGSVGRRSSVIFGPVIAREGSVSKAVVRSIPSLAMEGARSSRAEEEMEEEDDGDDDEMLEDLEVEEEEDGADAEGRDSVDLDARTEESPFVPLPPLYVDTSLDMGGLGFGAEGKGKGKEREVRMSMPSSSSIPSTMEGAQTPRQQQKTPTPQVWRGDYFSTRPPTADAPSSPFAVAPFTPAPPLAAVSRSVPMPGSPEERRPTMYKHASRSMVDVLASFGEAEAANGGKEAEVRGEAPAYDGPRRGGGTLKRRRSMPEIMAAPPPYSLRLAAPGASPHPLAQIQVMPREDEGKETLPAYSNSILLRGEMPRKMEFLAPGVQARDRKWRRVLCELEGTAFRVYRVPKEGWWERRLGAGDIANTAAAVNSAAAAATAAVKARAAAKEDAQAGKIAQEEAAIAASGSVHEEVGEENEHGISEVIIPPRSSTPSLSPNSNPQQASPTSSEGTPSITGRSRRNVGFGLLKPRSHGRSKSDLPNAPKSPTVSRSSLSIPRPSYNEGSGASSSGSGNASGASLSPSRSNISLASSRSGLPSARTGAQAARSKGKGKAGMDVPEPDPADLIRTYTLQHAESGLGNDYIKRKHVIRVRLEGEQFLLQARDVGDVVEWIEGLHSASNIALDLDERVMPKGPLFPRRRRRRPRGANGDTSETTNNNAPTMTLTAPR